MGQAEAKARALALVGQGYIYGAKGQICSLAFRQQQATQYPDQAEAILETGAKWDGRPVWDCAQLTREAAQAGGVTLVSGATSQWTKTAWRRKGTIETRPPCEVVFLYRQGEGRMQHAGVGLDDGSAVHAKGTAYGVVHDSTYPWTHWASPWASLWAGETGEAGMPGEEWTGMETLFQAAVTTLRDPLRIRSAPETGEVIGHIPMGKTVDVLDDSDQNWWRIRYGEMVGYASASYLVRVKYADQADIAQGVTEDAEDATTLIRDDGTRITLLGKWHLE